MTTPNIEKQVRSGLQLSTSISIALVVVLMTLAFNMGMLWSHIQENSRSIERLIELMEKSNIKYDNLLDKYHTKQ